jgi:hypothetical protein
LFGQHWTMLTIWCPHCCNVNWPTFQQHAPAPSTELRPS